MTSPHLLLNISELVVSEKATMSSAKDLRAFEDGTLYLFTSLTAGSSHIITATSRLETILKANRIPFQVGKVNIITEFSLLGSF